VKRPVKGETVAVVKSIDLVGVSSKNWHDAAEQALAEAGKSLRGIEGMDIIDTSAVVHENKIAEYHTHVRVRFRIER